MSPKIYISVIMSVYNGADFLCGSIPSVLNQTLPKEHYEFIIVDDASTDNGLTWETILAYERENPALITAIQSEVNKRQGGGRNLGIEAARGEYIIFLDADDYYLPHTLEHLYQAALPYNADLVEFDILYQMPEADLALTLATPVAYVIETTEARRNFVFNQGIGNIVNKLYKACMIRQNNIRFSEKVFYEEPSFIYPFKLCTRTYVRLNEALYVYIKNESSTCNSQVYDVRSKYDNMSAWIQSYAWFSTSIFFKEFYPEIEMLYLKWFLYTSIEFTIVKFGYINENELAYLQDFINTRFPDYAKNPYIGLFTDFTYQNGEDLITINLLDLCMQPLSIQNINIAEFKRRFISYLTKAAK